MTASPHTPATFATFLLTALQRWRSRTAFDDLTHEYSYGYAADTIAKVMAVFERDVGLRRAGVAVLSTNAVGAWIAASAAKLGGGYLVSIAAKSSVEDGAFTVRDSEASILVVHPDLAELGAGIVARCPELKAVYSLGPSDLAPDLMALAEREPSRTLRIAPDISHDEICEIKYTGGTTGPSKGAAHTQWSTYSQSLYIPPSFQLPYDPRYVAIAPISHAGYVWIAPTLFQGGTVILNPAFDPELFCHTVKEKHGTFTMGVPTMVYKLLDYADSHDVDLSAMQRFVYGASPMAVPRLVDAQARFGQIFAQAYGCVEALGTATTLPAGMHDVNKPEVLMSCGLPTLGTTVAVLDDEGNPVGDGEVGEICVRTTATMKEYWKQPEETAKVFEHGWLHTGDLGIRSETGLYTIVDRKKDVIVSGGFNVFSNQVEEVIAADDSVSMVAVIGVPDAQWGEAVKAVILARPGASVDAAAICALVRDKKGPVSTPKSIDVIDDMPLTKNGKIDKRALRERYWQGQERRVH